MRRCRGRAHVVVLFAALVVAGAGRTARADKVAESARSLRSSRDYKLRLSAALYLAKQHDSRAVSALSRALRIDKESTIRRIAALSLGILVDGSISSSARRFAVKSLEETAAGDPDERVRRGAAAALARVRSQEKALGGGAPEEGGGESSPAPVGGSHIFVHVGKANDLTRSLPSGSVEMVQAAVRGSLRRNAPDYQQSAGDPPTRSELASRRLRGYYVGAQVARVAVASHGNAAEVSCTVSMRVSPWTGRDGNERLVANESASATGSGRIQTSAGDARRAAADCAVAVTEELTTRQVVPFLRHVVSAN